MSDIAVKFVKKNKTYILCTVIFFRKSSLLRNNVEKYGRNKQASNDSIMQGIRFAHWVPNVSDRHSKYVILIAFPQKKCFQERASMLPLFVHCLFFVLTVYSVLLTKGIEGRPPIRRVAANKLNKQSRRADEGWSSSLGVERGANKPSL